VIRCYTAVSNLQDGAEPVGIIPRHLIRHLEWHPATDAPAEARVGEVRVEAKLTNAADEALARRGGLAAELVRTYRADAMVDTGSVRLIIPRHVADRLGLLTRGSRRVALADGRRESVDVTEALIIDIDGRDTAEEALVLGDEVLIGQTVLEKLDLFVDCAGQRLVPNPANPDQPITKLK
jgi:clan AA aspartic protease